MSSFQNVLTSSPAASDFVAEMFELFLTCSQGKTLYQALIHSTFIYSNPSVAHLL